MERTQKQISIPPHELADFEANLEAIKLGRGLPDDSKVIRYAVQVVADMERAK